MGCGKFGSVLGAVLLACSSSTLGTGMGKAAGSDAGTGGATTAPVCGPGDTRVCAGPGACRGAQTCLADRTGYGSCDCAGMSGAGGASTAGTGGMPAPTGGTAAFGGSGGTAAFGGATGIGIGGVTIGDGGPSSCAAVVVTPELIASDLYVMFDQSSSMGDPLPGTTSTWWSAAQAGFGAFAQSPRAAGLEVGLQYFPLNGVAPASCTADYATPEVEIGVLPANAASLLTSVQKHNPTTFTPTAPALSGAIAHMKAWATQHPGHNGSVALVTDGFPTECDPMQLADIAAIAKAGFDRAPKIRTFVIALNLGPSGANFQMVAAAGGTGGPVLIDGGDVSATLANALLAAAAGGSPCELLLQGPAGVKVDPNQVNVQIAGPSGPSTIGRVGSAAGCAASTTGGWYYDSPVSPARAILCPSTCSSLGSATPRLVLGCATVFGSGG